MPEAYERARRHRDDAREALPRHAGPRVHDPGRQALHAAEPQRQAHRRARRCAIAVDMVDGEADHREEAVLRVEPELARPAAAPDARSQGASQDACIARGPAGVARAPPAGRSSSPPTTPSGWAGAGQDGDPRARRDLARGHPRHEGRAQGILTARGGMTIHAAVVARGMGKCCVAGCAALARRLPTQTRRPLDERRRASVTLKEGDVHHARRRHRRGLRRRACRPSTPRSSGEFGELMSWADELRTAEGARQRRHARTTRSVARAFGAEGIGLCRTEHMFFEDERIDADARDDPRRRRARAAQRALAKLLPMQRERLRRASSAR